MKKILCVILVGLLYHPFFSRAQTISAIINNPDLFDGKIVTVRGELIGDIMTGKGGFWVNILDSESAIGVWLPDSEKGKIKFLGKYGVQGDFVQIKGIFNKRCIEHTGDTDIHAISLQILKTGMEKNEEIPVEKVVFAFSLGIVSLAAIGILHFLSRKESPPYDL